MTSIHARIKALRKAKGWSHKQLAEEVSRLEGLPKPLAWTSVQQWEREGGTAPKRKRLEFVALALGTSIESLLHGSGQSTPTAFTAGEPPPPAWPTLSNSVEQVVNAIAALTPSAWAMVRGALDSVVGHPEMLDDVAANVLMVLQAKPGKRLAIA